MDSAAAHIDCPLLIPAIRSIGQRSRGSNRAAAAMSSALEVQLFNQRKLARIRRLDAAVARAATLIPRRALPPIESLRPSRVLVLEPALLGDLVMSIPMLEALREMYPRAHITLAAHAPAEELYGVRRLADRVVRLRVPWSDYDYSRRGLQRLVRTVWRLRREGFDLALDMRGDVRNSLVLWLIGAARRVAPVLAGGAYFLTDVVPVPTDARHLSDLRTALLAHLGYRKQLGTPVLAVAPHAVRTAEEVVPPGAVVFHPGASRAEKLWPIEHCATFVRLVTGQGRHVLMLGVPAEEPRLRAIHEASRRDANIHFPTLDLLAAIVARASVAVTMDSAAAHVAAAVGTRVVCLFGPTSPDLSSARGVEGQVANIAAPNGQMASIRPDDVLAELYAASRS
jgi:heptosyltransferase-2